MVSKKENVGFMGLFKFFYDFNLFNKSVKVRDMFLFILLFTVLNFFVVLINQYSYSAYSEYSFWQVFLSLIFGLPLLIFGVFLMLYLFITAFEGEHAKDFLKSYLVYFTITVPYIFLGNFFSLLGIINNLVLIVLGNILIFIIVIYYMANILLSLKRYYDTSYVRIIVSFIFITMFNLFILLIYYLTYLLSIIRQ